MRFQIGGQGWPVNGGATLIPAGTIVEGEPPTWNHMILPLPLPIDATPLDDDAALEMLKWYEPEHWHRLQFGPGIDVNAIKMKAASMASTPRHPRRYVPSRS
jgi:hypothetical protein